MSRKRRDEADQGPESRCGSCGSPDAERREPVYPDCAAITPPDRPYQLLCDSCAEERDTLAERAVKRAQNAPGDIVAVALFECGNRKFVTEPEPVTVEVRPPSPGAETVEIRDPERTERPSVPVECRCGSGLDQVIWLDD